jgi:pimeloyl-ACP methyl ester carboxylesterase
VKEEIYRLNYEGFTMPYRKYGNGEEFLLAFHGYGRDGSDFAIFEKELGEKYTIIAFDFFFHGENNNLNFELPPFTPGILSNLIEKFLWEHRKISCSLMGYSLGGKLVLGCIHHLPHRVKEIFLMAPDGFTNGYASKLVTRSYIGRKFGQMCIQNPGMLFKLIQLSGKLGILSKKQTQLYLSNLETEEARKRVFDTWILLKDYKPHHGLAQHFLRTRPIRLELFFGRYDTIIRPDIANRFLNKIRRNKKPHLLETGHVLFKKHEEISRIILKT